MLQRSMSHTLPSVLKVSKSTSVSRRRCFRVSFSFSLQTTPCIARVWLNVTSCNSYSVTRSDSVSVMDCCSSENLRRSPCNALSTSALSLRSCCSLGKRGGAHEAWRQRCKADEPTHWSSESALPPFLGILLDVGIRGPQHLQPCVWPEPVGTNQENEERRGARQGRA